MSHDHCLVHGWGKEGEGAGGTSLSLPGTGGECLSAGAADNAEVTFLVLPPSHSPWSVFRASHLVTEAPRGPQNPFPAPPSSRVWLKA